MNELKTIGLPSGAAIKESACNAGDLDLILGSNPMDRGAWQAIVHGVTESDTTAHGHTKTRIV